MKEYTYTLAKNNPYQGEVKLKVLSFIERNKLLKEVNFKVGDSEVAVTENLDAVNKLAEICKEKVISFEVKKDGEYYTSWDEIDYNADVGDFYLDVGTVIVKGITLGNGSKKK